MKILSIETSSPYSGVSLLENDMPLISLINHKPFRHVEELPLLVERVLSYTQITLKDLSFIAISEGPGFFTGLRAGMSYARALAFSLEIPLLPIPTMEVIYAEYSLLNVELCLRLKGDKVFYLRFEQGKAKGKVRLLSLQDIETVYPLIIKEDAIPPHLVGILAYKKYIKGNKKIPNLEEIEPLYVQAPEVKAPKKNKKL